MDFTTAQRAQVLVEALPYIKQFSGKTVVIKYGGNAMISNELKSAVMQDIVLLSTVGIRVVLVHGGGPEINAMLKKIGKESKFVGGLRYTDRETMDVVEMVLAGKVNKSLVQQLEQHGGRAIGLCGLDGGMIKAKKLDDGKNDYGAVGEITEVNTKIITDNIAAGFIPVIATVAAGIDGESDVYNINSDTAAAKIAIALGAEKLILLTNTRGLMRDLHDDDTLIPEVKLGEIAALKEEGVISGGMIPKIECCEMCVKNGVKRAHIIDGRLLHSILIEMLSNEGIGTMIVE